MGPAASIRHHGARVPLAQIRWLASGCGRVRRKMAPRARHLKLLPTIPGELDETCVAATCTPAGAWLMADRVQLEAFVVALLAEGTR
jgi:hypothetical protein